MRVVLKRLHRRRTPERNKPTEHVRWPNRMAPCVGRSGESTLGTWPLVWDDLEVKFVPRDMHQRIEQERSVFQRSLLATDVSTVGLSVDSAYSSTVWVDPSWKMMTSFINGSIACGCVNNIQELRDQRVYCRPKRCTSWILIRDNCWHVDAVPMHAINFQKLLQSSKRNMFFTVAKSRTRSTVPCDSRCTGGISSNLKCKDAWSWNFTDVLSDLLFETRREEDNNHSCRVTDGARLHHCAACNKKYENEGRRRARRSKFWGRSQKTHGPVNPNLISS